ncbi:MAG: LON peptidase substrate-binding domain-containing protein [Fimbriimonas sp.]|nr:LON peptidase substrate-binding domain-containing protein [Fimbriimonas sp.]
MAKELEELPLFPLNTVLFPYASVQLHIFEDRYREMVRSCLESDRPFGIVLIRAGNEVSKHVDPYMVGTAVRIVQVHTYEDGRMDIQVQGERRFRIRELDESHSYLVGRVEPVVEHEIIESERASELLTRAREEFEVLIQRLFARQEFSVQVVFPTDPVALSFTIANLLQMENLEKQRLLETTDTLERVEDLLPILETQILEVKQPNYYRITGNDLREWITPN